MTNEVALHELVASEPSVASSRAQRRVLLSALGLAVAPFGASLISLFVNASGRYHASADEALIELRVRDIGRHIELLGVYSRFGWFHPGPALLYLLAVPYRLTGSTALSIAVAALVLNTVCAAAIVVVAQRRGGAPLMFLTVVILGLLVHGLGPQFLRDPWNPDLAILPLFLLILTTWSAACGETWAMPTSVGLASILMQTHLGYALLSVTLVVGGSIGFVLRAERGSRRRVAALSAAVVGILWLPPIVEQLTHDPGNLRLLFDFVTSHNGNQGWRTAWGVVAHPLSGSFPWVAGHRPGLMDPTTRAAFPLALILLLVAMLPAHRRFPDVFRLILLVVAAMAAGLVSVTRIYGGLLSYLVAWNWVLAAAAWLAVLWLFWLWIGTRSRAVWVLICAGAALITFANVLDAATAGTPHGEESAATARLSRAVIAALPHRDGIVEVTGVRVRAVGGNVGAGIALILEHAGIPVRVSKNLRGLYGDARALDGERVRLTVLPVRDHDLDRARSLPGFKPIAHADGVTVLVKRG
jgi:hypothetical protein